jgi:hypothetical protein
VLAGAGIAVVVVIAVFTFVMVVVGVSYVIIVAVSSFVVVTGFRISSNVFGEAPSHFTQKCKMRFDHEVTAAGEFFFEIFVPVFSIRI